MAVRPPERVASPVKLLSFESPCHFELVAVTAKLPAGIAASVALTPVELPPDDKSSQVELAETVALPELEVAPVELKAVMIMLLGKVSTSVEQQSVESTFPAELVMTTEQPEDVAPVR